MPGPDDLLLDRPQRLRGPRRRTIAQIGDAFASTGAPCSTSTPTPTTTAASTRSRGDTDTLVSALVAGARACTELIDLRSRAAATRTSARSTSRRIVYLDDARRGAACAAALVAGEELGRAGLPVFLYGELAGGRSRAQLRRGGLSALTERIAARELRARLRPAAPRPAHRRDARRRPPPARRLQRRARRARHARRRPRDRRAHPRGRRRGPARRARDRARADRQRRPRRAGLHERRGPPPHAAAHARRSGRTARRRRPLRARRARPAGGVRRLSRATCPWPTAAPSRTL